MVGVPGRSRACLPCKQRRVACDLQHPQCARCAKSQRECEYSQGLIFVLNEDGSHKTKYRKSYSVVSAPNAHAKEHSRPVLSKDYHVALISSSPDCDIEPCLASPMLCKAPPVGSIQRQALLATAISEGQRFSPKTFSGSVTRAILSDTTGSLCAPPLACYALWRGRQDCNIRLVQASHQLYIRGLAETQKALTDLSTTKADTTLAACNSLGLYEALECPDQELTAYMWHRAACINLVKIRGPGSHRDGIAHELFVGIRFFAILEALEIGRPTFLGRADWMTCPWDTIPKTPFDELTDIFVLGPEISRKGSLLKCISPDQVIAAALELVEDLSQINQRLLDLYHRYGEMYSGRILYQEHDPERNPCNCEGEFWTSFDETLIFAPALCFIDQETSFFLNMYWAILTIVWTGLTDLHILFLSHNLTDVFLKAMQSHGSEIKMSIEDIQLCWLLPARKVYSSVAFCTSPRALRSGPPRIATALNIVTETIKTRKGCEVEYQWGVAAQKAIGERWLRLLSFQKNQDVRQ